MLFKKKYYEYKINNNNNKYNKKTFKIDIFLLK